MDRRRYLFCSLVWGEIEFLVLVLGSLHYIGHGWTFDDIEEQTTISREMHRLFFHNFINFCSTSLYLWFVLTPLHLPEAWPNMQKYQYAGFPGCVSSTDCTHITTKRCEYHLVQARILRLNYYSQPLFVDNSHTLIPTLFSKCVTLSSHNSLKSFRNTCCAWAGGTYASSPDFCNNCQFYVIYLANEPYFEEFMIHNSRGFMILKNNWPNLLDLCHFLLNS